MKALYRPRDLEKKRIDKVVRQQYQQLYTEHQNEITKSIVVQMLAVTLHTLNVCEGFGKQRLRRIFDEINGTFEDMHGVGFAGAFDTDDLIQLVKDRYGIDLENEVTVYKSKNKD